MVHVARMEIHACWWQNCIRGNVCETLANDLFYYLCLKTCEEQ